MYLKYYFLLSGEHETLPKAELRAILEAENIKYRVIKNLDQVVLIEAINSPKKIAKIIERASMVKEVGILLGFHEAESLDQIRNSARNLDWSFLANRYFAVRAKRVKEYFPRVKSSFVEREIGALILSKEPSSKVNLSNPELIVRVLLTENCSVFGVKLAELDTKQFLKRRPRSRPIFHPGVLSPRISRLFVNLSRPRRGDLLGRNVKDIVRDFLNEASDIIKKNKYLVFALPHTVDPYEVIPGKAFELVETHSMRVHKSLTRIIIVLKRR
ncbi:MAG: hypothetical protein B6U75_03860 [Desulfurococcales archaeon ex4484_217_1]|nr:MAG: hypothetical protein B6U75_03860 [Desulfurococcales archaeon ex4484_217_1]